MPDSALNTPWKAVQPQSIPDHLVQVLGIREAGVVEMFVFSIAEQMVESYCGGLWRVESQQEEDGFAIRWVLDDDATERYTVTHGPNQVTTTMSAIGMGTTVTLFALYALAAKLQSEKAYDAYCRLVEASRNLQEWPYIARMID